MLSEEERTRRAKEKKAARMAKRAANKEAWKYHPANANAAWMQRQAEMMEATTAAIEVEPVPEAECGSLAKLRGIMADPAAPLYRRIDAAEIVLTYELAPGSLVNVAADQVAAASYRFMQAVIDATETPEPLRFRALKSVAAIENARASRAGATTDTTQREFWVALVNAARRSALIRAGVWDRVAADGAEWALSPGDEFDMPEVSRLSASTVRFGDDGSGIAIRMQELGRMPEGVVRAHGEAVDAMLRKVRANGRADHWERLLPAKRP
jgi:hypothetical protein